MGSNLSRDSAIGPQPIADDSADASAPAPSVNYFYDPAQSSDSTHPGSAHRWALVSAKWYRTIGSIRYSASPQAGAREQITVQGQITDSTVYRAI